MSTSGRWLQTYPGLPFFALGLVLVVGGGVHSWSHIRTPGRAIAELFVPVSTGIALMYSGYRVSTGRMSVSDSLQMLLITLTLTTIALSITVFNFAIDTWTNQPIADPVYGLLVAPGVGAAVGAPLGFYYVHLRKSHRELDAQYQNSHTLNKRLSVVQRVLRHNLRNELTIIAGITDVLVDDPSTEQLERTTQILDTHVDRLLDLTETAKLLDRVWELDTVERTDVAAVVEDSLRSVGTAHSTVEVELSAPETAPALVHPLFPEAIDEVVENAVEHNDPENLAITATVTTGVGPHDWTRVEIADTGQGIPEMEVTALGQSEEEPLSHGAGLGLWFVYSVVTKSGGELSLEENTPSGTVVKLDVLSPSTAESSRQTRLLDDVGGR